MPGFTVDVILSYSQIVAIMNPFSILGNYLTLTEGIRKEARAKILNTAVIAVTIIGLIFIIAGSLILRFYHLSVMAIKFGGGVLLMVIAIDMMSGMPRSKTVDKREIAVVPLATPMMVGPGTLAVLIYLGTAMPLLHAITGFLAGVLTVYATLMASGFFIRLLGRTGVRALSRFMSLILASIAAQMMYDAVAGWYIHLIGKCK
ncbi:MAG: MarC family protein [Desulfurococcales archaeon]|nr:MarC family protein [Desulfurococcales archaeon]MEB3759110.1 MarC family protein [Desulfurococcales archaeon]MEB3772583.1 MarC family protein [Desulfurococcales archaeon]MEB3799112.1 MarC family protein [Desulfurococcales archaeon]